MTIPLTVDQRGRLRRALQQGFDPTSLNMFLEERMDTRLADVVPLPDNFESQCNNLIQWAVAHGRLDELCQRIQDHIQERGGTPDLQQVVTELLASATKDTSGQPGEIQPYRIGPRPMLNRRQLWSCLKALARDSRTLIIAGEPATGKSWSQWLIGNYCSQSLRKPLFVFIDLNHGTEPEIDGVRLGQLIATRLWEQDVLRPFDDLSQPARATRSIADVLKKRLSTLDHETWLVIDGLNQVRIDETALSLLEELCLATDRGEIPKLVLILIGVEPDRFRPDVAYYTPTDRTSRPNRQDIEAFLTWFAADIGKEQEAASVLNDFVNDLDALLPPHLTHDAWNVFRAALVDKCRQIEQMQS